MLQCNKKNYKYLLKYSIFTINSLVFLSNNNNTNECAYNPVPLIASATVHHLIVPTAQKKPVTTMLTYPWKCTVLHCNHLGNTWKPLVLMT